MNESINFLKWTRDCKIYPFLLDSWQIEVPNNNPIVIAQTTERLFQLYTLGFTREDLLSGL